MCVCVCLMCCCNVFGQIFFSDTPHAPEIQLLCSKVLVYMG